MSRLGDVSRMLDASSKAFGDTSMKRALECQLSKGLLGEGACITFW
jgi:hypothetical protein